MAIYPSYYWSSLHQSWMNDAFCDTYTCIYMHLTGCNAVFICMIIQFSVFTKFVLQFFFNLFVLDQVLKKIIDRNHISVLYISFFISKNALDHLITLKFPDRSVYRWLQIWPWHPLQSLILGLISRKRWMSPMWKPIDHSLMSPMINWRKLLNIWTDLLEVNYIQTYDVASENARTLDGLNFNLSIESSSFIKVK